jgi:outer membrane protein assembly factor BamB
LGLAAGVSTAAETDAQDAAREILQATGVKGGLIVHLGCGDGTLTAALRASDAYTVHGLDTDPADVAKARKHIHAQELTGKVSVARRTGESLPYVGNLANLVVAEDLDGVPMDEVMRVLAPHGTAYVKQNGTWAKRVKPRPENIDEWTHYLHDPSNNAVAQDDAIGPPRHLQWVGSPYWARHHDHMASMSALVAANGRMFYIMDEGSRASIVLPSKWFLIARDAFNGTILWKRPMPTWHTQLWPLKSGPAQLSRRLVAVGDTVYATLSLDAPVTAMDAATGETLRVYEGTNATKELIASNGVLFLVVKKNDQPAIGAREYANVGEIRRQVRAKRWSGGKRILMAVRADDGDVLWHTETGFSPLTLAVDDQHAYLHDQQKVVCLDRQTGEQVWTSEPLPVWQNIHSWFAPTLVVYDDVVLWAGGEKMIPHRGGKDTMYALSAESGKTLWKAPHAPSGYQSEEDLLVANGLVWTGATTSGGYDGIFRGYDPRTGELKKEFPPTVQTYWFHHRCHRGKATDNYLLMSRTGIEFIDVEQETWEIHHWVRGGCLYGIMPCNGMIYAPPHNCACYPEAKLFGFNALAAASPSRRVPGTVSDDGRLERGPAYGQDVSGNAGPADWPTYRHDAGRTGATSVPVPTDLSPAWEATLGDDLSSLVIANGTLFIPTVDDHTVHALNAETGEERWSFTAGGRVDSPPTIYQGRALFGCADGYVYCLRADNGALMWRFRAAPQDRRLSAWEQVESVWPVSGSILVQDGAAYCVAGRSMFLDGGLRFFRLDPETGQKLTERVLDEKDPDTGKNLQERVQILNMPVALPDVLSSDGKHVYMRSQVFDLEGNRQDLGPHSGRPAEQGSVQQGETAHLFCPTGFLDGSWFHRAYWVYGRSFAGGHAGYWQAGRFAPSGRIMAVGDSAVYGYGRKPQYYRWTTPLEYHLFASDKESPQMDRRGPRPGHGTIVRVGKKANQNPAGKPLVLEAWVKAEKPNGVVFARGGPAHGYALVLHKGKPHFAVRVEEKVNAVGAKQKVGKDWTHLAGMLTPEKELRIYVNGELAGTGKSSGFIAEDPAQDMEIGADDAGPVGDYRSPFGLTGLVDEVRVYHGTVTEAELQKHMAAGGPAEAENARLVISYSFDKGKARDLSGNKNHGKVERCPVVDGKVGKALKFTGFRGRRSNRYFVEHLWTDDIGVIARAMVLAGDRLFVAGPPDLVNEDEVVRNLNDPSIQKKLAAQDAALQGRQGAVLLCVSVQDGKKVAEHKLPAAPAWDSMAAAHGRLYLATVDGKVMCLGGR